jgi:pyrophosphatase PpaX
MTSTGSHPLYSNMLNGHFETVLFDLDGTLIDSIQLILSSHRHTFRAHLGSEPADDVVIAGLGTPLWVQFEQFTDDPAVISGMLETYRLHNLEHHDRMVRQYPGVLDAVRQLRERRLNLAVVTSKKRQASLRGLDHCGLRELFEVIVAADDVDRHKPDPAPVHRALDGGGKSCRCLHRRGAMGTVFAEHVGTERTGLLARTAGGHRPPRHVRWTPLPIRRQLAAPTGLRSPILPP